MPDNKNNKGVCNMRIRSILLFLIFMMVFANLSVAQDSPIIHNSSNSQMMISKITNMEGPGGDNA